MKVAPPTPAALDSVLPWALGASFVILLTGCCAFAGKIATGDTEPEWRRQHWVEAAVMAGMMQIFIAPAVAGFLITFFLEGP